MTLILQTALNRADSFNDLLPIAEKAKAEISFFGTRYISVQGYIGKLDDMDELVRRVDRIMIQKPQWEAVRHSGKLVADQIDRIYSEDDLNLKNCGRVTRFFIFLRNLPISLFCHNTTSAKRSHWEMGIGLIFDCPFLEYTGSFNPEKKRGYLSLGSSLSANRAVLEISDRSSSYYRDQRVDLS